jgi:hypothetical protein
MSGGAGADLATILPLFGRASGAGLIQDLLDYLAGFAGLLLNPADQFVFLTFDITQVVIRQLGPPLLQFAFDDVPISLHLESVHVLVG